MPHAAKSFIARTHLPSSRLSKWRGISSSKQNTGLSSLKAKPHFGYKEEVSRLFPATWVPLGVSGGPLAGGPSLRTALWKDYADAKPPGHQAVTIYPPGVMWCEWPTGKTQGDRVTGKGCHLFIYFPPWVTNSSNRPLLESQEYKRTRGILQNSNWGTVDLIGVHLADNGEGSPAGRARDPGGI